MLRAHNAPRHALPLRRSYPVWTAGERDPNGGELSLLLRRGVRLLFLFLFL
jgi:hypothetical protein